MYLEKTCSAPRRRCRRDRSQPRARAHVHGSAEWPPSAREHRDGQPPLALCDNHAHRARAAHDLRRRFNTSRTHPPPPAPQALPPSPPLRRATCRMSRISGVATAGQSRLRAFHSSNTSADSLHGARQEHARYLFAMRDSSVRWTPYNRHGRRAIRDDRVCCDCSTYRRVADWRHTITSCNAPPHRCRSGQRAIARVVPSEASEL
jgi:hypothetical protein